MADVVLKRHCKLLSFFYNYHVKCPPFANTQACSRRRKSLTALSMAFSGKAEQINWSAS